MSKLIKYKNSVYTSATQYGQNLAENCAEIERLGKDVEEHLTMLIDHLQEKLNQPGYEQDTTIPVSWLKNMRHALTRIRGYNSMTKKIVQKPTA